MTAKLKITLFGSIQVQAGGKLIEQYRSESVRGLLFYLALTPAGPKQRSILATLFWPDASEKQARNNLRQILTRLRQAFNSVDPTLSKVLLTTTHKTITLQKELIWCDAVELQNHLTAVTNHAHQDLYACPTCWERLQQAVQLFQGDFLNGFHLVGSTSFNKWQDGLREHYHVQILLALDTLLVMAHQRGELALVQQFAQQQLALEPWREEGQRHLIWALTQLGETEAAIRQYEQFKALLEAEFGLQPEAETTALYRQIRTATTLELPNPYRGLQPFTAANAPFFYGRERYVVRLQALLQDQDFLVIIGPSGSGKSSLIQGGVLPRLQQPTNSSTWIIAQSRPGKRPFHNLSTAFKSLFPARQHKWLAELATGEVSLLEIAEQILTGRQQNGAGNGAMQRPRPSRLLLYVDQFEELFTLVPDKKIVDRFIEQLLEAQASRLPITIMLTMRADFMVEALAYPTLAEMTQRGLFLLGGMTSEEMQQAITLPAQKLNVTFEPGLVARLLHDVGQEPGQLPLLQFALTELWERRNLGQLTHAAYDAIGGLSGALANYADSIYEKLARVEKTEIRRLFFQLVRPGEQAADTRQVISSSHLSDYQWQLVQRLVETRLVVTDQEPSGSYTVELVHEALIQYWERLHEWLQTDRTFRLWYHRVQTVVRHWEQLAEDEGALLRGQPLAEAEKWFQEREADIGEATQRFILSSIGLRQRREAAAEAQREREQAFTLALQAQLALQQGETIKARALALAANEIGEPPPTARLLLSEAAYEPSTRWRTDAHNASVLDIAASPDQRTLLSAGADGVVHWRVLETGVSLTRFAAHTKDGKTAVHCVAFSPDGQTAVSGDGNGRLFWWHLETGNILQQLQAHEGIIWDVAFLPSGESVLTAGADKVMHRWQLATGSLEQTYAQHRGGVTCLAIHANGRLALSASEDQSLVLWEIGSGQLVRQMGHTIKYVAQQVIKRGHVGTVWGVAFHPQENSAISVAMDRSVIIWDLAEGRVSNYFQFDVSLLDLDISPDGNYALLATLSSQVCLYDLQRNQIVRRLQEHQQRVQAVCFAGPSLALSGSARGGLRLWTLHNGAEERAWRSHDSDILTGFALSPDGQKALGGFVSGQVCLWDVASGEVLRRWQAHGDAIIRNCHFGPNGRFAVTGSGDIYRQAKETTVKVWDVETGDMQHCFDEHTLHVWDVAFSPDGRFVLSTAHDGMVRYGCLANSSSRLLLDTAPQAALGVDISPDGRFAVLGMGKGTSEEPEYAVLIVEIETGDIIHRLHGHSEAIYTVCYGPNGRYALSGAHDSKVILWDTLSGQIVHELLGHQGVPCALNFHPTKPFAVSAAAENKVILWDLTQGVELRRWDGHDNIVMGLNFTPDGNHVVSGGSDNMVRVWRFDETKEDVLRWLENNREQEVG